MKELNLIQINEVSGGDRELVFTQVISPIGSVPSDCKQQFEALVGQQLPHSLQTADESTTSQISNANALIHNFMSSSCGEYYAHGYHSQVTQG